METTNRNYGVRHEIPPEGPTRWGNQLNGNMVMVSPNALQVSWPHSLGQSVEWKHFLTLLASGLECRPHSLGQSVEWKQVQAVSASDFLHLGPTRWGNQLNGNFNKFFSNRNNRGGPTRWGNQLNGNDNFRGLQKGAIYHLKGPTRWGNQLNGNSVVEQVEV